MTTTPVQSELPKGITKQDLARYAKLSAGIRALSDEKDILNSKIKVAYEQAKVTKGTFLYPTAAGTIIVDLGVRFSVDTATLKEDFPIETKPEFYTTTVALDTKKIPVDVVAKYRTIPTSSLSIKKA